MDAPPTEIEILDSGGIVIGGSSIFTTSPDNTATVESELAAYLVADGYTGATVELTYTAPATFAIRVFDADMTGNSIRLKADSGYTGEFTYNCEEQELLLLEDGLPILLEDGNYIFLE